MKRPKSLFKNALIQVQSVYVDFKVFVFEIKLFQDWCEKKLHFLFRIENFFSIRVHVQNNVFAPRDESADLISNFLFFCSSYVGNEFNSTLNSFIRINGPKRQINLSIRSLNVILYAKIDSIWCYLFEWKKEIDKNSILFSIQCLTIFCRNHNVFRCL